MLQGVGSLAPVSPAIWFPLSQKAAVRAHVWGMHATTKQARLINTCLFSFCCVVFFLTECVFFNNCAYLQGCAVCDLSGVHLRKKTKQNKKSLPHKTRAAWDYSNPLMMFNDTHHWKHIHQHKHTPFIQPPPSPLGAAAPPQLWNYTQVIIRSACSSLGTGGIHKHSCRCSFCLTSCGKKGERAPVEPAQALGRPWVHHPRVCLCEEGDTHTFC